MIKSSQKTLPGWKQNAYLKSDRLLGYVVLYGTLHGVPSPPASIVLDYKSNIMTENVYTLFSDKIMPNWNKWHDDDDSYVFLDENEKPGDWEMVSGLPYRSIFDKKNYQGISVPEGAGGISRFVYCEQAGQYSPTIFVKIPSGIQGSSKEWNITFSIKKIKIEEMKELPVTQNINHYSEEVFDFAVYNAESTTRYDSWVGISPMEPIIIDSNIFGGFIFSISLSETSQYEIGIDGLAVRYSD